MYANLRVATRVYDVEGGAIFLKIAHLSFSMGPRGPRSYGLCPRSEYVSPTLRPSDPRGAALSPCRVFLRNDVIELMVVPVAVVFVVRANVAVAV